MWYSSPSEGHHERVPPNEIVAAVESDLHTIMREDMESTESDRSAKALA